MRSNKICLIITVVDFPYYESLSLNTSLVLQAVEKVLAGAIRREMALEEFCAKQTAEITQLNRLVGFILLSGICPLSKDEIVTVVHFTFLTCFTFSYIYRSSSISMRGNAML